MKELQFNIPKIIGMVIGVMVMFVVGNQFFNVVGKGTAEVAYQSKTEALEAEYSRLLEGQEKERFMLQRRHTEQLCHLEKAIATSNWDDVANGIQIQKDMNILASKKLKECGEIIKVEFTPPETKPNTAQAAVFYDGETIEVDGATKDKFEESKPALTFTPKVPKQDPLDKLARAVAIAETSNCTKGYALTHNNCHGIKKGNTYPCKLKAGSRSRMCHFATKEESFVAFKVIWAKWYKNHIPTKANADVWTGKDRADTWLKHVKASL